MINKPATLFELFYNFNRFIYILWHNMNLFLTLRANFVCMCMTFKISSFYLSSKEHQMEHQAEHHIVPQKSGSSFYWTR